MHAVSHDAEIFYEVTGDGPPLVLLHPFPANHEFWKPLVPALAAHYRLVMPDLRGHGQSTAGDGPATMTKQADDLRRICDLLGIGRAVFAGVSIGGYVLMEFLRQQQERVAGLVLCDTRGGADTEEGRKNRLRAADEVEKHGPIPFIESMLPKLLGESTRRKRPDLVDAARRMMLQMTVRGIVAAQTGMAQRPDSMPTLKTVDVPTLIMVGAEDTLTPPAEAELMHQHINGSRMEVVPEAGHFAPFEQPDATLRLLRGFLEPLRW
jgi:pimeloyl-ACP methyl ester carboxylesterase